jgi:hypothetical protein
MTDTLNIYPVFSGYGQRLPEAVNQEIRITYMVRIQLYIFTQNRTLGIQLHVSALYIGHRQTVL